MFLWSLKIIHFTNFKSIRELTEEGEDRELMPLNSALKN